MTGNANVSLWSWTERAVTECLSACTKTTDLPRQLYHQLRPRCRTALSDEESEHVDTEGKLYYYAIETVGGKSADCGTTRPETMLGDVALAVNPRDVRYSKWVDVNVLPILKRALPVIADDFVDPNSEPAW